MRFAPSRLVAQRIVCIAGGPGAGNEEPVSGADVEDEACAVVIRQAYAVIFGASTVEIHAPSLCSRNGLQGLPTS